MDPYGNDESGVLSHEEEVFYSEIRGLVVVFLFFVILFTIAHLTVQYFITRPELDMKQDRSDRLAHQLVVGICTFTLTISLTGYSLLPFSIVANELLLGFPKSYYIQWLDTDLVKDLSLIVNLGTKISCLLLPFSYFLLIAQGFSVSSHPFTSRLLEAFSLLVFSYILVFGAVWSVGSVLAALHSLLVDSSLPTHAAVSTYSSSSTTSHRLPFLRVDKSTDGPTVTHIKDTNFFTMQPIPILMHSIQTLSWYEFWSKFVLYTLIRMLESVQLIASLLGLVLLFVCTPIGLVNMGFYLIRTSVQGLPNLTMPRSALMDQLAELHFDVLCLEDDLRSVELLRTTATRRSRSEHWHDRLSFLACPHNVGLVGDLRQVTDTMVPAIHARLPKLHREIVRVRRRISRNITFIIREWSRPLFPCLIFGLILFLLQLMQSYVFFHILELIWNLLFGPDQLPLRRGSVSTNPNAALSSITDGNNFDPGLVHLINPSTTSSFTLGHKPVSVFGYFGALLQICVIHFLLLVSLWGVYATPIGIQLRPRAHSMTLESLMANVVLLLLFSSALPLQSNLLGLTPVTLPSALKTKESVPTMQHVTSHEINQVQKQPQTDSFWHSWPLRLVFQPDSFSSDSYSAAHDGNHLPDPPNLQTTNRGAKKLDDSSGTPFLFSRLWDIFIPVSVFPNSAPYSDWIESSQSDHNRMRTSFTSTDDPIYLGPEERSLWTQFIFRAFGVSSPTSPASCGLIIIILLYNLCFLVTSVWIAGRRLNGLTWLFSLELVTSFRCVQQIRWTESPEGSHSDRFRSETLSTISTPSRLPCPMKNGALCVCRADDDELKPHLT